MQALDWNGVVTKIQDNFFLPVEVRDAIAPVIDRHGRKRKWLVYVAALLALLEEGEGAIAERVGRVASAEHTGGMKRLVDEAVKAGQLWDQGGQDGIGAAVRPPQSGPPPAAGRRTPRRRGKGDAAAEG